MKLLTNANLVLVSGGLDFPQPNNIGCSCWSGLEAIDVAYKNGEIDYNTSVQRAFSACSISELMAYQTLANSPK